MSVSADLALIVAWAHARVIGRDGALPWREPEDLAHFKQTTMGHALIMGRKTHESIGGPLPGRRNLIVTRNPAYEAAGCEVFRSVPEAVAAARETDDCPFVIGGASLYAATLADATLLYVTEIDLDVEGDTWFPAFDEDEWREREHHSSDDGRLVFRLLERRS